MSWRHSASLIHRVISGYPDTESNTNAASQTSIQIGLPTRASASIRAAFPAPARPFVAHVPDGPGRGHPVGGHLVCGLLAVQHGRLPVQRDRAATAAAGLVLPWSRSGRRRAGGAGRGRHSERLGLRPTDPHSGKPVAGADTAGQDRIQRCSRSDAVRLANTGTLCWSRYRETCA
jgi:hypothetical protein